MKFDNNVVKETSFIQLSSYCRKLLIWATVGCQVSYIQAPLQIQEHQRKRLEMEGNVPFLVNQPRRRELTTYWELLKVRSAGQHLFLQQKARLSASFQMRCYLMYACIQSHMRRIIFHLKKWLGKIWTWLNWKHCLEFYLFLMSIEETTSQLEKWLLMEEMNLEQLSVSEDWRNFWCSFELWRKLRFDNWSQRDAGPRRDRFASFRLFWDSFISNCQLNYNPGGQVCIDEQLIPYRGRCSFRQYLLSKPDKYGL